MKHSVKEFILEGGASGLVVNVPGSSVVNIQMRFNSGFQFGERKVYEVPHVMEHILATVTQKHSAPNAFNIEAQKNGAYVNAYTSVDTNGYVYECADFELDRILDLIEEQLTEPLFEPASLKAELGNVKEELSRMTTQHATVCSTSLAEKAYPHLWLDFDSRISQLPKITVDSVEQHYRRTHTSANGRFYVAGNFPDGGVSLAKRLDKIFRRLPKGDRLTRSSNMGLNIERPVVTIRDIQQLYYKIVMYFGELTEVERRAALLLRMVLVGGMGSRVLGEARRRGLAYSVGVVGHSEVGNSSFGFTGYVTPANADPLFEMIARQFANIRSGDLTKTELDAAKDLTIGSVKRSTQTPSDILGWYMEPYDEDGDIRDFDKNLEQLLDIGTDAIVQVATKAAGGHRRGLSFLGKIEEGTATDYEAKLNSIWQ